METDTVNRIIIATLALAAAMLFAVAHGQDEDVEGLAETPSADVLWLLFRDLREGIDGDEGEDGDDEGNDGDDNLDEGNDGKDGQGIDDHGNSRGTATTMEVGVPQSGTIEVGRDVDWFRIVVNESGTLTVYTTGSLHKADVRLYDSEGNRFDYNTFRVNVLNAHDVVVMDSDGNRFEYDVNGGEGTDFRIERHDIDAGTYFVSVGLRSNTVGLYTLHTEFGQDDHGDGRGDATTMEVGRPQPGRTEVFSDIDWFRFHVTERGYLRVYTTGSSDTIGSLYDSEGNQLAFLATNRGGYFRTERDVDEGTYFVSIGGYSGNRDYTLHTEFWKYGLEDDHGDGSSDATTMEIGMPQPGRIEVFTDVDWFRFRVTERGFLRIYTTGILNAVARLYDSEGNQLRTYIRRDRRAGFGYGQGVTEDVGEGTYYVSVGTRERRRAVGDYTLHTELLDYTLHTESGQDDDHGNDCGDATTIAVGAEQSGRIEPAGDLDWFRVVVNEPGILTVYTTGFLNTVGGLYDSECNRLANRLAATDRNDDLNDDLDNDRGEGRNFRTIREIGEGTYFLFVGGQHSDIGAYTLHTEAGQDDHGDGRGDATTIGTVKLGAPQTGRIETAYDVDWFRIRVTESGILMVYTTTEEGHYDVNLYDSDGNELASRSYVSHSYAGDHQYYKIERDVDEGNYFVSVAAHDYLDRFTGVNHPIYDLGYTLTLHMGVEDDHGDSRDDATTIDVGVPQSGKIDVLGDADWFRVRVAESGNLTIYLTDSFAVGKLESLGEDALAFGYEIHYDGLNTTVVRQVDEGTYHFVAVQGYRTTGDYILQTELEQDDHGDSRRDATRIEVGVPQPGSIEPSRDVDWFRIVVNETGSLAVYTTASHNAVLGLYDREGIPLDYNVIGVRAVLQVDRGIYFVSVRSNDRTDRGDYTLHTEFQEDDDHGDSPGDATTMQVGVPQSGRLETAVDVDWFRVVINEFGVWTVHTTETLDPVVRLHGEGSRFLGIRPSGRQSYEIDAGTYFVVVSAPSDLSGAHVGDYTLHVEPLEDDHGNSIGDATTVDLGVPQSSRFEEPGDIDSFRIDVTEPGTLTVYTTGSLDTEGRLFRDDGFHVGLLTTDQDGGDSRNFRIERQVDTVTYYVNVRSARRTTGDYTLHAEFTRPDADDHGNILDDATTLALDGQQSGRIEPWNDHDWFRIDITEPGTLTVYTTASTVGTDTVGRLYDSAGNQLAADCCLGENLNFKIIHQVDTGIYYVTVRGAVEAVRRERRTTGDYIIHAEFTPD